MNILHLKYAVEVEKTRSINKAAQNLYMGQPNLSRAIKDLEESLGIVIFNRTTRGMFVTPQGEEFLQHAKVILNQIDEVESIYNQEKNIKQKFSISVPRSGYISHAFSRFVRNVDATKPIEFFYRETNSARAINNVLHMDYNLGIIRYADNHHKNFKKMMSDKGLVYEVLTKFTYNIAISKNHPLAEKEEIELSDLDEFIEIAYADPFVPSMPFNEVKKEELPNNIDKRILVFERASSIDLLNTVHGAFLQVYPDKNEIPDGQGIIQRPFKSNTRIYRDVLIYRNDYQLTPLDVQFLERLQKMKNS